MTDQQPGTTRSAHALGFETASWPRRMLAFLVDAVASALVVVAVLGLERYLDPEGPGSWLVLLAYLVESALFTATIGGSFGKMVTRLRVVHASGDPRPVALHKVAARQALIALLIPPLVFRPDGRGLHDLAAGSATVTLQTYRALAGKG